MVQNGKTSPITGTDVSRRLATLDEKEYAAFAELNYMITDKLKVTAGRAIPASPRVTRRFSRARCSTRRSRRSRCSHSSNPNAVVPAGYFLPTSNATAVHPFPNQAGDAYDNFSIGQIKEKPFNPKVGISYQATESNLFYATMSRGYRGRQREHAGNPRPVRTGHRGPRRPDAAAVQLRPGDQLRSRGQDPRLQQQAGQLNPSAFYIDWKDPQLSVTLRCAFVYVTNAKGLNPRASSSKARTGSCRACRSTLPPATPTPSTPTTSASPVRRRLSTPHIFIVKKGGSLGHPEVAVQPREPSTASTPSSCRPTCGWITSTRAIYQRGSAPGTVAYNPVTVKVVKPALRRLGPASPSRASTSRFLREQRLQLRERC